MLPSPLHIERTCFQLPAGMVTNDDLARAHPAWNIDQAIKSTGVRQRFVSGADETAGDLALAACRRLLQEVAEPDRIEALIFCTQSPDYVMPSNAFVLHKALGLPERCLAFDYTLSCSGFVYGLAIAQGLMSAGLAGRVLLVTADTYSKLVHPEDRAVSLLFGDGAAATLLTAADGTLRALDMAFGTAGTHYDAFIVPAGGARTPRSPAAEEAFTDANGNTRSRCHINMNGKDILAFVNSRIPAHVRELLARNGLGEDDVELYVFHQASRSVLDSLTRLLGLPPAKVASNLERVGNTVASSIPILLNEILASRRLRPGDRMVLCGFGVGLSWGSVLMEVT